MLLLDVDTLFEVFQCLKADLSPATAHIGLPLPCPYLVVVVEACVNPAKIALEVCGLQTSTPQIAP